MDDIAYRESNVTWHADGPVVTLMQNPYVQFIRGQSGRVRGPILYSDSNWQQFEGPLLWISICGPQATARALAAGRLACDWLCGYMELCPVDFLRNVPNKSRFTSVFSENITLFESLSKIASWCSLCGKRIVITMQVAYLWSGQLHSFHVKIENDIS